MTRGKPWDAADEQWLRDLVKEGKNAMEIAEAMDKTYESVKMKLWNLGLSVKEQTPREQTVCSSSLDLSQGLPSIEEKLKVLNAALVALEQLGLSRTEVLRLRSIVQGVKTYREEFEKYVDYRGLEFEVLGLRKKVEESKTDVSELRKKLEESQLEALGLKKKAEESTNEVSELRRNLEESKVEILELRKKLEEANKEPADPQGSNVSR